MELNILDKRQTCANCRFNSGEVYASNPVKYKCTFDNNYYDGIHPCHLDLVPVVRCRDCAIPHNSWTGCPKLNGCVTRPNDYCSYGIKE